MSKNERCPLQEECEKKCTYMKHELDCPYYNANARGTWSSTTRRNAAKECGDSRKRKNLPP